MENTKPKLKSKFRGRFKFSLCKWLRINNKIYTETDEPRKTDWDKDGLINGNNPVIVNRRSPVFHIRL